MKTCEHAVEEDRQIRLAPLPSSYPRRSHMVGELLGSIPSDELMLWIDWMFPAMNLPECAELLGAMRTGAPPEAFKAFAERVHMARGESDWQKLKTLLAL
jgi:hypothetical protein